MDIAQPNIRFTLRQLQYFSTVARSGQISLAAAECHITQSTMTSAIAELERVLGTLLFERSRSGVTLTYEGHQFLTQAHAVLEAAGDVARHPFRDERSTVHGSLTLAASYTVLGYFLLPYIARFKKQHPGIQLTLLEQDRGQIEAGIESGAFELAIALTSNLSDPKRFERLRLARSRRQLWAAPTHPLADLPHASLEDVAAYTYIFPLVDEGELAALRYWSEAQLQPASVVRTSSMEAIREMVALGLGVTILSDMVYRPWSLEGRRIQAIPLKNPIPPMEVGLIWRRGAHLSPVAEALRNYLQMAVDSHGRE